jgi:hypothetical protein
MDVYELTARELYDTFADNADPMMLAEQGRDELATRLMTEEELDEEDAYYAADQILSYAQEQGPNIPPPR